MKAPPSQPGGKTLYTGRLGWVSILIPVLLIAALITVILVSAIGSVAQTTSAVRSDMRARLYANAQIIDGKIDDLFRSIEGVAPMMAFEAGSTQEQMLRGMNALRDANDFDFVVRTNAKGIAFNYLGKENIDLSQRSYIHKALTGARAVEYITSGAYDTENPFIILAVPILYDGRTVGVLHGSYKTVNFVALLESLSDPFWQGCDEISIVTDGGVMVATSGDPSDAARQAAVNQLVSGDIAHAEGGYLSAEAGATTRHYYVQHLTTETDGRWHIMARMEEGYLEQRTSYALNSSLVMLGIAICIALVLLYIIIGRQKLTIELDKRSKLLSDALVAAEKAGAAKSQFLSRVSHEMRTPLNAIIGFIELAKGSDRENMENCLASSDLAAHQLLNVINDVLDMSSIESGRLKIAEVPFDFKRLVSSITNIYGTQCKQKGIDFETTIDAPLDDWLIGDELRANQILMNLLSNAVKFTTHGHVHLTISTLSAQRDKLLLRFVISDTGCGMSEDMMERLFKPFEQENASTARRYGGSGLGLSIVKSLVEMMSGSVRAESRQGEGTTFTVDLPFGKSEIKSESMLPDKIKGLRILAVDDQQAERDYIGAVLKRLGVRYACVASGGEALDALTRSEKENDLFNVCLIDWCMPGLDGAETARLIRQKFGKDVTVIVASAYDFHQETDGARRAGADLFISKPLFQSSLFDLLMTLTDGKLAKATQEPTGWDFAGRRVLLVEDNALNQLVAKGYLMKSNITVELAENGRVAVDRFEASTPGYYDAILMDIQMPVMDGLEAARAIRQSKHPQAATIQIIAQTADAFDEDVAKALSAGMNAHIAKPLQQERLNEALNKAFSVAVGAEKPAAMS